MCGMAAPARCTPASRRDQPDLMAIAKGLGGGYMPIGALLVQDKIFDAVPRAPAPSSTPHLYGHPLACAAALTVQRVIRRDDLLANVRVQGAYLSRRLKERFGNHPFVGDVRGRGLFQGLELVAIATRKNPSIRNRKLHARVKREAMARGLMVYPMGGTVDGARGDHVLAPPFIVMRPGGRHRRAPREAIDAATGTWKPSHEPRSAGNREPPCCATAVARESYATTWPGNPRLAAQLPTRPARPPPSRRAWCGRKRGCASPRR